MIPTTERIIESVTCDGEVGMGVCVCRVIAVFSHIF